MGKAYVCFSLGAARYCLPVEQVVQIVRRENLIGVPGSLPSVEGAINLRGDVIPVLDLRLRLAETVEADAAGRSPGGEEREYRRRVVIARLGGRLYGLDVDEVREIVDFEEASITPADGGVPGEGHGLVAGVVRGEGGEIMLLDLARALEARPGED
jgi:purine-binding chemotaxis protein CheW